VAVGNGPDGIVANPTTHTLYTDNQNDNSVSVINISACHAGATQGCGQRVRSVVLPKGSSPQGIALDVTTGTLYVADQASNSVSVIDAGTCNAVDSSGCGQVAATIKDPYGPIAFGVNDVNDTIYVANCGNTCSGGPVTADEVSVINGAACNANDTSGCSQVLPTVRVGPLPAAAAVDPTTNTIYVANDASDTVSVIDGATCNGAVHSGCGQHTATITVGDSPNWIAFDQANHSAYTADQGNNAVGSAVSVINTATCNATDLTGCDQRTPTVAVGAQPWALTVDVALHTVFVINNWDDTISAINTTTCSATDATGCSQETPTSQVGPGPQAITLDPTTGTMYVANFVDSTVSVVDASGCDAPSSGGCRDVPPIATVGAFPSALAVDMASNTVYVADQDAGTVSLVNAATCNVARHTACGAPVAIVRVGKAPAGVAIDQATGTVYVVNSGAGTVSVIDGVTCNAQQTSGCARTPPTVRVGKSPLGIDVDQATDTVYVSNLGTSEKGDTVSVINGATCNSYDDAGCGQIPPTATVGVAPFDLAVNQVTNTVYVANTGQLGLTGSVGDTVSVINGATCNGTQHAGCGRATATVKVGPYPFGVAINEASNTIYIVDNNGGDGPASLSVLNGATCDAANTSGCRQGPPALPGVGRAPRGIALDPSTGHVYTANHQDATVSVLDVGSRTVVPAPPRFAVGRRPIAVAVDPANHTVYVANSLDSTVPRQ
jgi:YVTN family beta-propeller protein